MFSENIEVKLLFSLGSVAGGIDGMFLIIYFSLSTESIPSMLSVSWILTSFSILQWCGINVVIRGSLISIHFLVLCSVVPVNRAKTVFLRYVFLCWLTLCLTASFKNGSFLCGVCLGFSTPVTFIWWDVLCGSSFSCWLLWYVPVSRCGGGVWGN